MIQVTLTFANESEAIRALQLIANEEQVVKVKNSSLTPVQEWIGKQTNISTKLVNILSNEGYPQSFDESYWAKEMRRKTAKFEHIETITRLQFMSHYGAGKVSWNEFVRLRGY